MADTYTSSLRFTQPQVGASTSWATSLNTDMTLIDTAIAGVSNVSIAALTTYTLTANNGSADESRAPLYRFTGALSANCTVTMPAAAKIGWATNATTGGYNVILNCGTSGTSLTLPPTTGAHYLYVNNGTNVEAPAMGFSAINVSGTAAIAGATTMNSVSMTGSLTVSAGITTTTMVTTGAVAISGGTTQTVASLGDTLELFSVTGTGTVGSIASTAGGGTVYNTTSDYRIKTLTGPFLTGTLIDRVPVHSGHFNKAPDITRPMFVAHEVQAVLPWAVMGEKDAVDEDGEIVPQMLDHSALVPILWAELRSVRKRLKELEAWFNI